MKKLLLTLTVFTLLMTACANPAAVISTPLPTEPAPTPVPENELMARGAAMDDLAKALGVPLEQIKFISLEALDWQDSCLGIVYINAICAAVITPGYRIVLEADGTQYVYHTNADGTLAVAAKTEGLDIPELLQRTVREALANVLGVEYTNIVVVSAEAVEWPDGCLGIVRPGIMCTQVITPGFRIILSADGQQYEYRTNADGSVIVAAEVSLGVSEELQRIAREALSKALGIDISAIALVSAAAVEWPDSCLGVAQPNTACLDAITPGALIVLEANGMTFEYHTNADGSVIVPATIALSWHREGGIAGFCDDLIVFLGGEVRASSCQGKASNGNLSVEELAQLHQWITSFGLVRVSHKDDAVADAMTIELMLNGTGNQEAAEADQQMLTAWAQAVYTRVTSATLEQ